MTAVDEPTELRLERMLVTISLASIGDYEAAIDQPAVVREDALGLLEEGLRLLMAELKASRDAHAHAIAALQRASAEIEQKLALIEAQRATIRALSSPVLDVWRGVLAVPLVGRIDDAGMLDVAEKLLQRIVADRARWIVVDLTGVESVDAASADHLVRLGRAVALIGATCLFTGIGPAAADTLAAHGVGADVLPSLPSLRDALHHCLTRMDAARRPGP